MYEPLVNLGGVLINMRKFDEALELNVHAVLVRPGDALANSQLGMTYFEVGNFDTAIKYLERARKIDPAHFSHPQSISRRSTCGAMKSAKPPRCWRIT